MLQNPDFIRSLAAAVFRKPAHGIPDGFIRLYTKPADFDRHWLRLSEDEFHAVDLVQREVNLIEMLLGLRNDPDRDGLIVAFGRKTVFERLRIKVRNQIETQAWISLVKPSRATPTTLIGKRLGNFSSFSLSLDAIGLALCIKLKT